MDSARKIYTLHVRGEYITRSGDRTELKHYRGKFRVFDLENALGTLRGKLLTPFLRKKDPGTVLPHSWHVYKVECENGSLDITDIPVRMMDFSQLKKLCKLRKLPVPVEMYGNLDICRHHVMIALEDKERPGDTQVFPQVFDRYKERLTKEKEIMDLNEDLFNQGSAGEDVRIDPETGQVHVHEAAEEEDDAETEAVLG